MSEDRGGGRYSPRVAIAVRDSYDPVDPAPGETVVHDSEGAKRPDGTPLD